MQVTKGQTAGKLTIRNNMGTTYTCLRDLQTGAVVNLATQLSYQFKVSNASAPLTGRFELSKKPRWNCFRRGFSR